MPDPVSTLHQVAGCGRLGQPVFLRLQITAPPGRAIEAIAEALAAAAQLFQNAPASLHARGDEATGVLQAVLLFRTGACLLVYTGPGEATSNAMLLGNHGAAYAPAAPFAADHRVDCGARESWASRIRQSLSERRTVALERESDA